MGTCVDHMVQRGFRQMWDTRNQNVEIPQYTRGLYDSRELAMGRMQAEARMHRAESVVGVVLQILYDVWTWHTTEFIAVGTAVRPLRADHQIATPTTVVPLG